MAQKVVVVLMEQAKLLVLSFDLILSWDSIRVVHRLRQESIFGGSTLTEGLSVFSLILGHVGLRLH